MSKGTNEWIKEALENGLIQVPARDLRIGNWIQNWNGEWQVVHTDFQMVFHDKRVCWGIPLSKDWLERFGFYNRKGDSWATLDLPMFPKEYSGGELHCYLRLGATPNGTYSAFHEQKCDKGFTDYKIYQVVKRVLDAGRSRKGFNGNSCVPMAKESVHLQEIKHVHQLQNLVYALCGTELTIKESHANLNSK